MRPNIKLGRIFGIEIGLHYSWFIIALLIVFSLAGHFQIVNPQWEPALRWTMAVITALLFFASVLAHELSHAAVAKGTGIPVKSITLFALGGVANIEVDAKSARSELWIAAVGPATSSVIGIFFITVAWAAGWRPQSGPPPTPLGAGLIWLGYINVLLAAFNMIPGYPLDGGRILRSILWEVTGNLARATRIAALVGQCFAAMLILFGLLRFFSNGGIDGLWLAFIGWFLADAAAASYAGAQASVELANLRVGDVMSQDCPRVDAHVNLRTFAEEYLLRTGRRCFVVMDEGRPLGLITINEPKRVERSRWASTTVAQVALPIEQMRTVAPDTPLTEALALIVADDLNQLPVISNGKLAGTISRSDILQFLQIRKELKAA